MVPVVMQFYGKIMDNDLNIRFNGVRFNQLENHFVTRDQSEKIKSTLEGCGKVFTRQVQRGKQDYQIVPPVTINLKVAGIRRVIITEKVKLLLTLYRPLPHPLFLFVKPKLLALPPLPPKKSQQKIAL